MSWGFVATAIAFSTNGWRDEYGQAFDHACVVVLPGNDAPRRKFAETVKAGVEAHGATAVIVELPGLPSKGDIMDRQGTPDALRSLAANAFEGSLLPVPRSPWGHFRRSS